MKNLDAVLVDEDVPTKIYVDTRVLDNLADVTSVGPIDGVPLRWDGTAAQWKPLAGTDQLRASHYRPLSGAAGRLRDDGGTFVAMRWASNGVTLFADSNHNGGGTGVLGIANATAVPTADVAGASLLYVEAGVLKVRNADAVGGTPVATRAYVDPRSVPLGGTLDQVLAKNSTTNYDLKWVTPAAGGGGISRVVSSISGATTAAAVAKTDYVYICTAALTLTLPTAVGNANMYTVKRTGTGNVTVATTSSQTIDGASTFVLDVQYMAIDLVSNGTNWSVI